MIIEADQLAVALARVKSAVELRSTIPILGSCLVASEAGKLSITGNDITFTATATIAGEGDLAPACFPYWLLEVGARLKGKHLEITHDGQQAEIRSGQAKYCGGVLPADNFPLPGWEFSASGAIEGKALARALAFVATAISNEETRYYLKGVNMEGMAGGLVITATDGHRLHSMEVDCDISLDSPVIVPRRAVDELTRMGTAAGDDVISVQIGDAAIAAEYPGWRITSKLIDGTFPDWRRVVPRASGKTLAFDVAEAADAVSRMIRAHSGSRSAEGQKTLSSAIIIRPGESDFCISIDGIAEESVAAEVAGAPDVAVNGGYLRDTLQAISALGVEIVAWDVSDAGAPSLMEPAPGATCVITPMRMHIVKGSE